MLESSIHKNDLGAKSWPYGAHGYSTPSGLGFKLHLKSVRKRVRVCQSLNYRSKPVGKDDRREYVRGGVRHGG